MLIQKRIRRRARQTLIYLILLLTLLTGILALYKGTTHLANLRADRITIQDLPGSLLLSFIRMSVSYFFSLLFAFIIGLAAAKSKFWERILIPFLDIMQAFPVVAFFPVAVGVFIAISGGHRIGIEAACIFLIFTSQAWNIAFAIYEATKTLPSVYADAVDAMGVKGSLKFWKLHAPACVPRIVTNSILSWSNGWFFLVACEIIAIGKERFYLPGIGSFLARAAEEDQVHLLFWGLLALTLLVVAMDSLFWRPATQWAEKFRQEHSSSHIEAGPPGLKLTLPPQVMRRMTPFRAAARSLTRKLTRPIFLFFEKVLLPLLWDVPHLLVTAVTNWAEEQGQNTKISRTREFVKNTRGVQALLFWAAGIGLGAIAGVTLGKWLVPPWPSIAKEIPLAILASTGRLILALLISLSWTLPLALLVWDKPKLRQFLTTIAQIGASIPAIALFPLILVLAVKKFGGGQEIITLVLLLSGMQWYLLFNCLGGTANIPADLRETARSLGLSRYKTYLRLVIPALRPSLITGAITSWGGGWNALVVSEYLVYKEKVLSVNGLGALLNRSVYELGDQKAIVLCVAAMVGWIVLINALFWGPLYRHSAEKYSLSE